MKQIIYKPGEVFNKCEQMVHKKNPEFERVLIHYPTRLEAMVFDPCLVEINPNHIYTAGQVNFVVDLMRKIEIEVLDSDGEVVIDGEGIRKSLINHAVKIMQKAIGNSKSLKIKYSDDVSIKHAGFGSSSATIAGVCVAINELYGNPISKYSLVKYIVQNHVEEVDGDENSVYPVQSIGGSALAGIYGGGLICVAGECVVIKELNLDESYSVIIAVPKDYIPKSGEELMKAEEENMAGFVNTGKEYGREIAYRFLHKCLPDLTLGSISSVGDLIYDYRFNMGSIRNCSFCYPGLVELADKLRVIKESGLAEILALSSVGPGFFAITKNPEEVSELFESNSMNVIKTKIYNYGYKCTK